MHVIILNYDASTKITIKFVTLKSAAVCFNGSSYNGDITGDLDIYHYIVINMVPTNDMSAFAILTYRRVNTSFEYDYMQIGYIYRITDGRVSFSGNTDTWACFCIPR